jgi:hypothetical protein
MMTAALLLLMSRRHYAWSYAVLALAIGFKVVPIILAPLWALASLPLAAVARPLRGRQLLHLSGALLRRLALLGLLVLATFLPFYLAAGPRSLVFLGYHAKRGIEFESTYAALLGSLHLLGYPITVRPAYGSCDILSPLSTFLSRLAPFLVGGLLLAAGCLLLTSLIRWVRAAAPALGPAAAVGRSFRGEVLSYTLLFLLLFITANKVFSPQYVLWVLTLAPAVPLKSWSRRAFLGAFVALCAVTWLICPRYMSAVLSPTPFGTALLVARSLLLFGLIAGLVWALIRRYRFGPLSQGLDG